MSPFFNQLDNLQNHKHSLLCIGLDSNLENMPPILMHDLDPVFSFNREIIDATADLVCCYKPQIAFYSANQTETSLVKTIGYAHDRGVPVILDAKRGDIGSTAAMYAKELFDRYDADAVTINPYMGEDAMQPFLERRDKGIYILCRTSNPGGADLQNLVLDSGITLYEQVARLAGGKWNSQHNVGLVVGATYPEEIRRIRAIVAEMNLLLPGIGAQGADMKSLMASANGGGRVINSSRAIIYASHQADFADKARQVASATRDAINQFRST